MNPNEEKTLKPKLDDWTDELVKDKNALRSDRNQILAEVFHYYREYVAKNTEQPEKFLILPHHLEEEARAIQEKQNDDNDDLMKLALDLFLDIKLSVNWDTMNFFEKQSYYKNQYFEKVVSLAMSFALQSFLNLLWTCR